MKKRNGYEYKDIKLIKKLIEKNNCEFTYQRKEILIELIRNNEKHLNAEKVYGKIKHKGIGISTVYRTLKLFTDLEILKEFKINDINYYKLKIFIQESMHIHFQCKNCGSIESIVNEKMILRYLEIKKVIEKSYKFEINDSGIILYGLCDKCIDKGRWKNV